MATMVAQPSAPAASIDTQHEDMIVSSHPVPLSRSSSPSFAAFICWWNLPVFHVVFCCCVRAVFVATGSRTRRGQQQYAGLSDTGSVSYVSTLTGKLHLQNIHEDPTFPSTPVHV
eukprot:701853-Rhodomonas_salina.2